VKGVTSANFRRDYSHPRVARAVEELLAEKGMVAPIDVFARLGLLSELGLAAWRSGEASSLEEVLECDAVKAARLLEILRLHARELKLKATTAPYIVERKGERYLLRFSRREDPAFDKAFSRHYLPLAKPWDW
jgi:hypothetical protein